MSQNVGSHAFSCSCHQSILGAWSLKNKSLGDTVCEMRGPLDDRGGVLSQKGGERGMSVWRHQRENFVWMSNVWLVWEQGVPSPLSQCILLCHRRNSADTTLLPFCPLVFWNMNLHNEIVEGRVAEWLCEGLQILSISVQFRSRPPRCFWNQSKKTFIVCFFLADGQSMGTLFDLKPDIIRFWPFSLIVIFLGQGPASLGTQGRSVTDMWLVFEWFLMSIRLACDRRRRSWGTKESVFSFFAVADDHSILDWMGDNYCYFYINWW